MCLRHQKSPDYQDSFLVYISKIFIFCDDDDDDDGGDDDDDGYGLQQNLRCLRLKT